MSAWTISYLPWAKEKHPTVDHGRALGGEASSNYLTNEIQDAFRLQSVKVNDKHIKVVVRQTLQKAEILVGRLIPAGAVGRLPPVAISELPWVTEEVKSAE